MKYAAILFAALLLMLGALTGCHKEVTEEPEPVDHVQELFKEAREQFENGDTNGAISRLEAAIGDTKYASGERNIYASVISLKLMADDVEGAKTRFLAATTEAPQTAAYCLGMIHRHYTDREDADAAMAWTKQLLDAGLDEAVAGPTFGRYLGMLDEQEGFDAALAEVPACIAQFSPDAAANVLSGFIRSLLSGRRYEDFERCRDAVKAAGKDDSVFAELIDMSQLNYLTGKKDWPAAAAQFGRVLASVDAKKLIRPYSTLLTGMLKDKQYALADSLCVLVLEKQDVNPQLARTAASKWVDAAKQQKDNAAIVTRIGSVLEGVLGATEVLQLYDRTFYDVVQNAGGAEREAMLKIGDQLIAGLEDEKDRGRVRTMLLDGAFLAEDYDRALKILRAGIPSREEEWHAMAINKVSAHKALKEGRTDDAVAHFRDFMEHVRTWETGQQDPSTGVMHTREMTLGFNARRIGNIYRDAERAEDAAKAYAEARDYYNLALKDVKADSKEAELIQQALDELPQP